MNPKHVQRRNSGQGLVEFALIAPILLFTVMGIVDFGRAMIVYAQGSAAVRNAARYAEVWGGQAADNHQYLECGDGEAIQNLSGEVMFASVTTKVIFVKEGYYDQNNDFLDDGDHTLTCEEAQANPDALQTGDMLIIGTTGSFNTITPLIHNLLPAATFQFRAQRTIITNLRVGETTSTSGNGIVNCSAGSTQPEVTVRTSRPSSVAEGGNAIFTFSLCEPSDENVTVEYTVGGTAVGADYSGLAPGTYTLTFTPGQQSHAIPVSILADAIQENTSETIVVTLTSITSGTAEIGAPSVATVLILNDNPSGLCSQLEIQVGYLSWGALRFKIQNVGSQDYDYSALRLYYYYTSSSGNTMGADASLQTGDNVTLAAVPTQSGNSGYLEIRVTNSGTLRGSSNDYVSGSLQLHEGSNYNFGNISNLNDDPSSEGVATNGIPVLVHKVPLTVSGTVVCGEHPDGSGGGSTSFPTVFINPGSTSVNEGSTANLTVSLTEASASDVTVQISLTGNASSSDYGPPTPPSTITIPAGQTSVALSILIRDDTDQELAETLVVSLVDVTTDNADIHFSSYYTNIVIPANDTMPTVFLSPTTASVIEGSPTSVTFNLSGAATSNVYVQYTLSGSASSSDYSPSTTPASMTIPMGQTTATLNLSITDDSAQESAETVIVTLTSVTSSNATVGSPSSATITIPANDAPGAVTIAASPTSVNEGATVRFTATRTQPLSQAATVAYTASGGTATSGSDYPVTSGTFTFAANEATQYIDVVMTEDTAVEGNETFTFALSAPSGMVLGTPSTVDVTIVDNDVPTISISGEGNVNEGSSRDLTVTLSAPSPQTVKVQCTVAAASTATLTTDYTIASGTGYVGCNQQIVFAPNETTKTIRINAIDESPSLDEVDETVIITLSGPELATIGTATAQVTIVDTDATPQVYISSYPTSPVNEGTSATFQVSLTGASSQAITVQYGTAPVGSTTEDVDYTRTYGSLTFPASSTAPQSITVSVLQDPDTTEDEKFAVNLSTITPTGSATLDSSRQSAQATIKNVAASNLNVSIKYPDTVATGQKEIRIHLLVTNQGTTTIPLNQLKLRYYFNREGTVSLVYITDYAQNTSNWAGIKGDITGVFTYGTGVNSYVELSFGSGAGSLTAGTSAYIEMRIHTSDWSEIINETNDWSYLSSAPNAWTQWNRVPLYQNGGLVWGGVP